MRTAINITGELKYVLDNEKDRVVVPFYTLQASELIKQDIELLNNDYSVALYGFRYEAETSVGTFRYFFLVEHSLAGFRPYMIHHKLPDNVRPLRDTIDFSILSIAEPAADAQQDMMQASVAPDAPPRTLWRRLCKKYLPDKGMDTSQRQQQRRSGVILLVLAAACTLTMALVHLFTPPEPKAPYSQSSSQLLRTHP